MKMKKAETQKLCEMYNLGDFYSVKPIKGGLDNYNFELKTDKGRYVVRVMSGPMNVWRRKSLRKIFRVVRFLREIKFLYEVPEFMLNKYSKYICRLNKKNIIVYKRISGKSLVRINDKQFNELILVLAKYHKYIMNFKEMKDAPQETFEWVYEGYLKLRKIKPKNRVDKIMKKNLDFVESAFKKAMKNKINENVIMAHGDIMRDNVLFEGDKARALIDFDDLEKTAKVHDIAITARDCCVIGGKFDIKKYELFLKEYEKVNKLSKKEKNAIPYYMLLRICVVYPWVYLYMKKDYDKRYKHLKDLYNEARSIVEIFGIK